MDWQQAQAAVRKSILRGTDVNTPRSSFRFVEELEVPLFSKSYGYRGEAGFVVRVGKARSSVVSIPWSMLRSCFEAASSPRGYDGDVFRHLFPKQARIHPCHVHVVARILEVAGLVTLIEGVYRAKD
jgi:hypothetical protein